MATLTYTPSSPLGVAVSFAAASVGGDAVLPNADGAVLVRNDDATSTTVTVAVPGSQYGQARPDFTYTVAAGATAVLGPFPRDLVNDDGLVSLTYSKVTSLSVAAVSVR